MGAPACQCRGEEQGSVKSIPSALGEARLCRAAPTLVLVGQPRAAAGWQGLRYILDRFYRLAAWSVVVGGSAFFTYRSLQFSISATVCKTDSRAA